MSATDSVLSKSVATTLVVSGLLAATYVLTHRPAIALWTAQSPAVRTAPPLAAAASRQDLGAAVAGSRAEVGGPMAPAHLLYSAAPSSQGMVAPMLAFAAAFPVAFLGALALLRRTATAAPPVALCSYGGLMHSPPLRPSHPSASMGHRQRIVARSAGSTVDAEPRTLKLIEDEGLRALLEETDVFVFDCDGVIWKGDSLIEGVPETLEYLKSLGKKLFFVTNNSTKSRAGYLDKFLSLGLTVRADEVYSSSFAAAAYLQSINYPKDRPIYIIGEVGIEQELALAGFTFLGGPKDAGKVVELKAGFALEHDHNVGAVVVGFDRHFNYYKIQYAQLCINENPGCLFIATNTDAVTHLTDAQEWAGNGSMVGCIKGCTGKEPVVVGKPSGFMMDNIAATFHIPKHRICMVGDRLDTDILFGQHNGTNDMLVLSGVTTPETLLSAKNKVQPTAVANSIADFLRLKAQ
eukprot:EG_transcript_11638